MDGDTITRTGVRVPGVERRGPFAWRCLRAQRAPTQSREQTLEAAGTKEGCKQGGCDTWAPLAGRRLFDKPALQPYRGKPAVRNDRGTMETSASYQARSAPSPYPTVP